MESNIEKCIKELYKLFKHKPYWDELKFHLNNTNISKELFIDGVMYLTDIHCKGAAFERIRKTSNFQHKHLLEVVTPILNKNNIISFSVASKNNTTIYKKNNSKWVEFSNYGW